MSATATAPSKNGQRQLISNLLRSPGLQGFRHSATWEYPGDRFAVLRFDDGNGGKSFRPVHSDGDGWQVGDPEGLLPLYRYDELGEGTVYVLEGEKCCDLARGIGLNAVSSAHGSKSAAKSDWTQLRGRDVVIIPDNDPAGIDYAADVWEILSGLDCTGKVIALPGLETGEDIAEWLARLPDSADAAGLINEMADTAPSLNELAPQTESRTASDTDTAPDKRDSYADWARRFISDTGSIVAWHTGTEEFYHYNGRRYAPMSKKHLQLEVIAWLNNRCDKVTERKAAEIVTQIAAHGMIANPRCRPFSSTTIPETLIRLSHARMGSLRLVPTER